MSTLQVDTIQKTNGSAPTLADLSISHAGSVLQTVTDTQGSDATNSTSNWTDTGLSASITPTSSSSKVLVIVTQPTIVTRTVSDNWLGGLKLLRGSTDIGCADAYTLGQSHSSHDFAGNNGATYWWWTSHELDSPSTTSSTTYKTQSRADGDGSVATVSESRITLMEIAG